MGQVSSLVPSLPVATVVKWFKISSVVCCFVLTVWDKERALPQLSTLNNSANSKTWASVWQGWTQMSSSPETGLMETEEELVEPSQCLWPMSKEPSRALTGSHMKNCLHTMQIVDPWLSPLRLSEYFLLPRDHQKWCEHVLEVCEMTLELQRHYI